MQKQLIHAAAMLLIAVTATSAAEDKATTQPAGALPAPIEYEAPKELGKLDGTINESSGIAVARAVRGAFWTHNDSGDSPRLFAIDHKGKTLITLDITGAQARDWEDMCSFIDYRGESKLLIGDIGDNAAKRPTCMLYVVNEPWPYPGKTGLKLSAGVRESIEFVYEDGPRNAEAIAVDPAGNKIYIASRSVRQRDKVYELPWPKKDRKGRRVDKGPYTAKAIATLPMASVTAMDISRDGRRCVVLGWKHAREFVRGENETWAQAFARKGRHLPMPPRAQGESICYGTDGKSLFLTSERKGGPEAPLLTLHAKGATDPILLTVYATGDIHEHTENFPRIAQYVRIARKLDPNVLLMDSGDMCGGNGEKSIGASNGVAMWALLTASGYDACILGNHDYGKGLGRIEELCRMYPKWPGLLANVNWTEEHKKRGLHKLLPPTKTVKLQGLTVGIIGVGSHDLRYSRMPKQLITYAPPAVKGLVPVMRRQSDIVVAVTHQYEDDDYWKTATGELKNTPDLIVGGHSHGAYTMPYGYRYKRSFIVKAGPYIKRLGAVQFSWDGERIVERIGTLLNPAADWPEAEDIKALRDKFRREGEQKLNKAG